MATSSKTRKLILVAILFGAVAVVAAVLLSVGLTSSSSSTSEPEDLEVEPTEDGNCCLEEVKQPHIVLVMACTFGWSDISYNNPVMKTPNLDYLARGGVILNQSYVQPLCTPSRVSLMTGYYPFRTGLGRQTIGDRRPHYLRRNYTTLAEALKPLGYAAHMIGKWHLGSCRWDVTPYFRGFDSFYGTLYEGMDYYDHSKEGDEGPGTPYDMPFNAFRDNTGAVLHETGKHASELFSERLVSIVERHNPDTPLFLYYPSILPHTPYQVPDHYLDLYNLTDNRNLRTTRAMVSMLDDVIGNLTDALRSKGMWNDTLFVFLTDHGARSVQGRNWPFRGGRTTTFEGGIRSVAFVHGAMLEKTGYINNELIHVSDLFPTLLTLAGGTPDPGLDGMDVWATLSKGAPSPRTEVVHHMDIHPETFSYAIRVGDYKLIGESYHIQGNENQVNPLDTWVPPPELEDPDIPEVSSPININQTLLFNIAEDPREVNDLAEAMPEKLQELLDRAQEYIDAAPPPFWPERDYSGSDPTKTDNIWTPGWC